MSDYCANCNKPEPRGVCAHCPSIKYCNSDCQVAHWSLHKISCVSKLKLTQMSVSVDHSIDQTATTQFKQVIENPPAHLQAYDDAMKAYVVRDTGSLKGDARTFVQWQDSLTRVLDEHRPNGIRWQAQTPLVGTSLLTVLNTSLYDTLLQAALDPTYGISVWKKARKSPLLLPDIFQPGVDNSTVQSDGAINAFIQYIYAYWIDVHNAMSDDPMLPEMPYVLQHFGGVPESEMLRFAAFVSLNWDRFLMPRERITVNLIRPNALRGDVLVWTSFHGSAAAVGTAAPHLTMFWDAVPRDVFDAESRQALFEMQTTRPIDIGSGLKAARHSGWNRAYNIARGLTGGLTRLDPSSDKQLANYLHGQDSAESTAFNAYSPFLTPEDRRQLNENGYIIIRSARMDAMTGGNWSTLCTRVINEFEDYMNWVLFEQQGRAEQLRFSRPDDVAWEVLKGESKLVAKHYGDPMLFRVKNKDGNRSASAQSGGTLLAGDNGFGAAANAYDLPAQVTMRSSPALYSLFSDLYGTKQLLMVPERFRIKVAAKILKTHTDALAVLPP